MHACDCMPHYPMRWLPPTQVYCYSTIREWFKTGNRLCPRTNIEVQDVQVGVTSRDEWLRGLRKQRIDEVQLIMVPHALEQAVRRELLCHPVEFASVGPIIGNAASIGHLPFSSGLRPLLRLSSLLLLMCFPHALLSLSCVLGS